MSGISYSLGYGYNQLGQLTNIVYPDGNAATYGYYYGVVSSVQVNIGGSSINVATNILYQPANAGMSQWTSSNNLINQMSYDNDGRLTSVSAGVIQRLSIGYDAADRLVRLTDGVDTAMSQSFGYSDMSRLTSVQSAADNQTFSYDANGNRTLQNNNGSPITFTIAPGSNQVTNRITGQNILYRYDPRGNLTDVLGVPYFTYDAFNRMSAANGSTYYVNPEGQRLRKTVAGQTTYFAPHQTGPLLAENQTSNGWIDYVWLNGRLIGRVNQGQILAVHDDQVGRPEVMTDNLGAVQWRARNTAFDRSIVVENQVPLNLGFPGQYYDSESNLSNNGFRDYSPLLGRYVESDPTGMQGGLNSYIYLNNGPLDAMDPFGLAGCNINLQSLSSLAYQATLGPDGKQRTQGGGKCATTVRGVLDKAGGPHLPPLSPFGTNTPTNAAWGGTLTGSNCYVVVTDLGSYTPGRGDIAITEGNGTGHIAVYDGKTWDADIARPGPVPGSGANYAGSHPVIYRYVGAQ